MTAENVIKIEDARELRGLGLPILPIVDKEFSRAAEKLMIEAGKAKAHFCVAFSEYCKAASPTKQQFDRMRKALRKIAAIGDRAAKFTSPDEYEVGALQLILTLPINSFVDYWDGALTTVEGGEPITINITKEMLDEWLLPNES